MKEFDIKEFLRDVFPFDTYRPNQEEVYLKCYKAISEGKAVIIRAPPGFGKSPVAVAVGLLFGDAYYITPQKVLQRQLDNDYSKYLTLVLGRSNFNCKTRPGYDCSKGKCQLKKSFDCEHKKECEYIIETGYQSVSIAPCDYVLQREKGLDSKIVLMNFAYFYLAREYFGFRNILIVDEAHNIPEIMVDYISLTIHETDVDYIPRYEKFKDYLEWLERDALTSIKKQIDKIEALLDGFSDSEHVDSKEIEELLKEKRDLKNLTWRINNLIEDYKKYNEEWVFEIVSGKEASKIKFQPVTVDRFLPSMLWRFTNKILLMSGSIPDARMFMREIGLGEVPVELIDVPSTFPVENRLIYYYPVAKMTKEQKLESLPKIAEVCSDIIRKHGNQKGIIHCHTYQNAQLLYSSLGEDIRQRAILQKENTREKSLDEWFSSKNKFFLSVDMTEGLDLKDDLCRWQVSIKVPYPFMGDMRVRKRVMDRGERRWYNGEAIKAMIQTYGRAVRSEKDYASYYILDSSFGNLYRRYKAMFPPYFIEAVRYIKEVR